MRPRTIVPAVRGATFGDWETIRRVDNAVLEPVVSGIARDLTGSVLGDVVQIDSRRFALRFSVPPFPRLCVALHPDLSAIHVAARVAAPKEPTELAVALSQVLGGMALAAVRKEPEERVVELEFAGGESARAFLVFELLGKASNLLLLDAERRILRFVRSHAGAFRRPREGEPYAPPPRREGPGAPLPLGSRLLAREVETRVARGERREDAAAGVVARLRGGDLAPCLYTPRPAAEIGEADDLNPSTCFAAPFPVLAGAALARTDFGTANEAAAAHTDLLLRHLFFRDLKGGLTSLVRGETERLDRLAAKLAREALEARGAAEARRQAELVLASLGTARKEGDGVEVVDYYDPDLPRVRIPIDARLDLKGNAEALFRRARKLDRAAAVIAGRLRETEARRAALHEAAARIQAAARSEEVADLEREINRSGLLKVFRKPERRELGRKPSFVHVREHRTRDGYTVLIGKSGSENDTLTFKVAAPHDFWFHAAGRPGAHVVVRNPKRQRDLPEAALMEAAAIAAWFSRGDRAGEIEVHYTQRKEVRKGKGMSPGMVLLRNHRTVLVRPAPPGGARDEEG